LITQQVFIAETCAWVRWKGILLKKKSKNKKNQQQFFIFVGGFIA
jgi:hypothetical protein